MKNKLITDEEREEYFLMRNQPFPENRRSGKSTGAALFNIGKAMINPGKEIPILDHYGTKEFNRHIAIELTKYMLKTLSLKHFEFKWNKDHYTIKYTVFEEEDE